MVDNCWVGIDLNQIKQFYRFKRELTNDYVFNRQTKEQGAINIGEKLIDSKKHKNNKRILSQELYKL